MLIPASLRALRVLCGPNPAFQPLTAYQPVIGSSEGVRESLQRVLDRSKRLMGSDNGLFGPAEGLFGSPKGLFGSSKDLFGSSKDIRSVAKDILSVARRQGRLAGALGWGGMRPGAETRADAGPPLDKAARRSTRRRAA